MEKYSLEVQNWGDWELEKDFASLDRAKRYGLERYSQNEWRVIDRRSGNVVHSHDPSAALEEIAREESRRFAETARWREVYAERAAAAVVARQQRERMAEVASRQRENDTRRRNRLQGFRFVGDAPDILNTGRGRLAEVLRDNHMLGEGVWDDILSRPKDGLGKVDWKKEGF